VTTGSIVTKMIAPSAAVLLLCCLSGLADAQGFLHASRVWEGGHFVRSALFKSAMAFGAGIGLYWLSIRFMHQVGVHAAEMQTSIWFAATIIGVAVGGGRFARWTISDQLVATAVILGLGWLLLRSTGSP
jgi:hypothetical protein